MCLALLILLLSEGFFRIFPGKICGKCCFGSFGNSLVMLVLLCYGSVGFCEDYTMVSVPLGFEISGYDSSKMWLSENGVFAFGFMEKDKVDDDADAFSVGIRYNLGKDGVNLAVWTVGGGLKVPVNSTFRLNMDGRLVLTENPSRIIVWSSNTSSLGVQKASLLNNGNLVLLDAKDKVVWQSFSSPTNTLLPGQFLRYPLSLRATSTKSISSYYNLAIRQSGELALVWEHNVTYWRIYFSSSGVVKEARFDSSGIFGLYDDSNKTAWSVSSKDFGDTSVIWRHLRIDQDGNLRIYSWDNVMHNWRIGWQAVEDQCNVFGTCGIYSICGYNSSNPVCDCLYSDSMGLGIDASAVDSGGSGCKKMVDLANCRTHNSMLVMKQTVLYGLYPPNDVNILLSQEACKEYCLNDTTCIAATSKNDGSGLCTIKRTNFISGYNTPSIPSISFLKVCFVPEAVAARGADPHSNAESVSLGSDKIKEGRSSRKFIGAIALIVLVTVLVVLSMEVLAFSFLYRRRKFKAQTRIPYGKDAEMNPHYSVLIRLTFEEIKELTDDFTCQLGPSIFRGALPNKTPVVAKMLNAAVVSEKEFRIAVSTLGGTHHRNLVPLKGFCFEPKHKLLLYEHVSNGSLDKWLFSSKKDEQYLSSQQRLNIIFGVARAVAYLHSECQQCITHGNLTVENVLIDENLAPKVTDFGIHTLLIKQTASSSSESPSERDIYMLGVLLLQTLTCKRDVIGESAQQILDKLSLERRFSGSDELMTVERVVRIAFWCMQNQPFMRPSIGEVVKVLEGTLSVDRPPSGFVRCESKTDKDDATEIEVQS